jgi:hypothetical protein
LNENLRTDGQTFEDVKPETTREEILRKLKKLNLTREEKAALFNLSFETRTIGRVVVQVGLWIVETIVNIASRFPMTCAGAVVGLVIFFLLNSIPLAGGVLAFLAAPLIALITVGMGLFQDLGLQVQAMVDANTRRYREQHR